MMPNKKRVKRGGKTNIQNRKEVLSIMPFNFTKVLLFYRRENWIERTRKGELVKNQIPKLHPALKQYYPPKMKFQI